jgi:DNA-binding response OmpR family regulator
MPSEVGRTDTDAPEPVEYPERRHAPASPTVDEFGILRQSGAFVILAPSEQALAQVLITDFGRVVRDDILEQHVVSTSVARRSTLRKHASRLRKRVAPLGLAVTCFRNVGYMMHHDDLGISAGTERSSSER